MDDEESLRNWSEIRALEPDRQDAFLCPARLLRDLGRFDEADILLSEAIGRFPSAAEPLIEFAFVAHSAGKWDEALARWEKVRLQFVHPVGYLYAGKTLIAAGRLDEADALLSEAFELFSDNRETVSDHAWIAVHRGKWREGLRRFQNGVVRFPDAATLYVGAAFCLRKLRRLEEADDCLAGAVTRFPDEISLMKEWVSVALERSDWPAARSRSDLMLSRWPDRPDGYISSIHSLVKLEHYEEAEIRSASALARFSGIADLYQSHAAIAMHRGFVDEAIWRYRDFGARFPTDVRAYVEAGALLAARSKWTEAAQLLTEGCENVPNEPILHLELAKLGMALERGKPRNLPEALKHAEVLTARFPEFERGHVTLLSILADAEEFDRAEAIANQLIKQFPHSPDIAVGHARTATARGALGVAVERFFRVVDNFSENPAGYIGLSEALCAARRFDEAEEAISGAIKLFPGFRPIVHEYAQVATRRGNWPLALARWTEAQETLPSDLLISTMIFETRMRLAELDPERVGVIEPHGDMAAPEDTKKPPLLVDPLLQMTERELVMQFESLGGALLGCEFGIFQRRFGAEPLGLLRWTEIRPDELIKALEARFSGVGLPENTELQTRSTDKGLEYLTSDKNYYMSMHTFVYEFSMPKEEAFSKFCKRLQYLQRKLIEDLQDSNKIFVYKLSAYDLPDPDIEKIHGAMRLIGNNTLLYVKRALDNKPSGLVELVKPGLLIGYIDRFAVNTEGVDEGVPVESWLNVCRAAYKIWKRNP
jgi:tetratricopeptide (TPR) repeat protein